MKKYAMFLSVTMAFFVGCKQETGKQCKVESVIRYENGLVVDTMQKPTFQGVAPSVKYFSNDGEMYVVDQTTEANKTLLVKTKQMGETVVYVQKQPQAIHYITEKSATIDAVEGSRRQVFTMTCGE